LVSQQHEQRKVEQPELLLMLEVFSGEQRPMPLVVGDEPIEEQEEEFEDITKQLIACINVIVQ
jgi:hypothetical protein